MILTLKNKHIYLPTYNNVLTNSDLVEIKVGDLLDLKNYNTTAFVNGIQIPFQGSFKIPADVLHANYLELKIVLTSISGSECIEYVADKKPITRAFILGSSSKEWYPSVVGSLIDRVTALEKSSTKHDEALIEHGINITLALNGIDEINKKGDVL